ncbi:DUF3967 domain-containing protein [Bacillus cereus]
MKKNKYLIDQECIPVFQFIAKMRNKRNLQKKQIIELLSKEGFPEYIDIEPIQTTKQQKQQQDFQKSIVQRMDERDQNLITMIRENQETKKLIVTTQQKKWWQFWK